MRVIYVILMALGGGAAGLGLTLVEAGMYTYGAALALTGTVVAVTAFLKGAKDSDERWAAYTDQQRLDEFNKWRRP